MDLARHACGGLSQRAPSEDDAISPCSDSVAPSPVGLSPNSWLFILLFCREHALSVNQML